jgi:hypothetical protein
MNVVMGTSPLVARLPLDAAVNPALLTPFSPLKDYDPVSVCLILLRVEAKLGGGRLDHAGYVRG